MSNAEVNEQHFREEIADLILAADAYILALRQMVYAAKPDVRRRASESLNRLSADWPKGSAHEPRHPHGPARV